MTRLIAALIASTAIAACVPSGPGQPAQSGGGSGGGSGGAAYHHVPVAGPVATAEEQAACAAAGGVVQPGGLLGYENCVQAFADADRACSDSSECIGRCLVAGEFADPGAPAIGQCERSDSPFGCTQEVIGGQADAALCAD